MTRIRDLATEERTEFAALLAALPLKEWHSPTLCTEWTVQDVVIHTIAYLGQSAPAVVLNMMRAGGDIDRLNARALRNHDQPSPAELIELMRRDTAPAGVGALFGGRVALIECLVHHQDIRRALGRPRPICPARIRPCLNFARISPLIRGGRRTRGIRLVATDMTWSAGSGPTVYGTGEALLLAITGRMHAVRAELAGEGATLFVQPKPEHPGQ